MKNNPLDDIIKCDVEISSPGSSDVSFDSILFGWVAGPAAKGTATISGTTAISKADELLNYGYKTDSPAYIAATVAFSQNPSPDELYIIVREKTAEKSAYEDVDTTLARADSEASFYGIHLTEFRDSTDIEAAKTWAEANEKLYAFEYTDINSCPVREFRFLPYIRYFLRTRRWLCRQKNSLLKTSMQHWLGWLSVSDMTRELRHGTSRNWQQSLLRSCQRSRRKHWEQRISTHFSAMQDATVQWAA